jgi:hypothetical protein
MITTMAEDSNRLDKDSLYNLLTIGYPKNRRKADAPAPAGYHKNRRKEDKDRTVMTAMEGDEDFLKEKPKHQSVVLSVESGPLKGERFSMELPCTIGRKDCDLILDDRLISRRHAEIKFVENKLVIKDLSSTNGTKVNGIFVKKKQLVPNDIISIGPANLRISPESLSD